MEFRQAINEIEVSVHLAQEAKEQSPFFVIAGAGVSAPSVPLASGIMEHCRTECQRLGRPLPKETGNPATDYGKLFEAAYPGRGDRRRYIERIAANRPASQAVLRLAHLLQDPARGLTNLVVTINFDDTIERALRLLGAEPAVSDHPLTADRVDPSGTAPGVVHVHGSYWFYDCCNREGEIEKRAESLPEQPYSTMSEYLDRVLTSRSPIVVGYAGWKSDVVMKALERRLMRDGGLRSNLYWFAYQHEEAAALPPWLRDHPDVRVVAPPGPADERPDRRTTVIDMAQGKAVLSAETVLGALVSVLELPDPRLFVRPLRAFRRQLVDALTKDGSSGIYNVAGVLTDLRRAEGLLLCSRRTESPSPTQQALTHVRTWVRQANYRGAVHAASAVDLADYSWDQLRELFGLLAETCPAPWVEERLATDDLLAQVANRLLDPGTPATTLQPSEHAQIAGVLNNRAWRLYKAGEGEEAMAVLDAVIARYGEDSSLPLRETMARVRLNKGIILGHPGSSNEEVTSYDEVVTRYGDDPSSALRELVAAALLNKGIASERMGRGEAAMAAYDGVVARYTDDASPVLRGVVARALLNKGAMMGRLGRPGGALGALERVLSRYRDDGRPFLREVVARALLGKGYALRDMGRGEGALAAYDDIVTRYGDDPSPALREVVARALFNKGVQLGQMGRREEAIAAYDEAIAHYGDDPSPALREVAAGALSNRGVALEKLDRSDEAIQAFDQVVIRYGDDRAPALRERVAGALFSKGVTLGQLGRSEDAIRAFDQGVRRYGDDRAPALREKVAAALFSKGITLGQLGRSEDEIAVYNEVDERYGRDTSPALRERVARALVNKGVAMERLGRSEEAMTAYGEVEERYGRDPSPALRTLVARAHANAGFRLAMMAAMEPDKAESLSAEATRRFEQAEELAPGSSLYNRACLAALSGDEDACRDLLLKAETGGTLPSRSHMENDTDLDSVRTSAWFRELLSRAKND
ncbi:tetratricopeptide repeat protein [bacterium]|nr:tetratricopeptide repeat protein [bacterium]